MAKAGMKRPDVRDEKKNELPPVPEIQGKAKAGHEKAKPMIVPNHRSKK